MQELSQNPDNCGYPVPMNTGRPAKSKRTAFGSRLHKAREAKGLSQKQIADELDIAQQTYASWERSRSAIRPDDLIKLTRILNIDINELLGIKPVAKKTGGPTGKARKTFERVSKLPRYQQQRILGTVEDMLIAQEARAS